MAKRLKMLVLLGFVAFILTACGAQVHTETVLSKDGSGERTVILAIAKKDEGKIDGGFEKLEQLLKESAPSCVSVNCHLNEKDAKMMYEFTYHFADIEEMREKTKQIIGKEPNIQWEKLEGVMAGEVSYYEETSTKELIQWAIDALQKKSINNAVISQLYEETDSKVIFEGDVVWSGQDNAQFKIDMTPVLEEVSVYTTYDDNGEFTKQIKLGFSYEDYRNMNTDEGLAYLKEFSEKFKVDETCNGYSVSINSGKDAEAFFDKASDKLEDSSIYSDLGIVKPLGVYYFGNDTQNTVFSDFLNVTEVYNLNKLLAGFKVSTNRIRDFVFIPERESYKKQLVHHTYALESNEYYNYIGEYDITDMYYLGFQGGSQAKVKDAQVEISIDENMEGVQTVTIDLDKEGKKFTSNDIVEYYSKLGEKIQFEESEDSVSIQFIKQFRLAKSSSLNVSRTKYGYDEAFSFENYYPELSCEVNYTVKVAGTFRVDSFSFGKENLNRQEIKALKDNVQWIYAAQVEGAKNQKIDIGLIVSKTNMIFYGILGILILLFVGIGLSIYFALREKNKQE